MSEGERFGRLTVVRMASPGSVVCRCDCGQEKEYPIDNLLRDRVHSCGCAKGRRPSVRVGKRYGNLTVLELADNGHCVCQCDCGNTTEVLKEDLTAGKVTSCGCLEEQPEPFVAFG
ncbi:MAG: hypothetical protein IJ088_09045 [Clostridia bacterium]|nr:hypothetical protein [Clostridia bacterium]